MKVRHMFAGVNTPHGFFSRFDQIMPESTDTRKIYIKGGPGMGKSTLMKKIVDRAKKEGMDCEVFHCSSDPSSLDGLHIPALKFSIIDATAPHNSDPEYPCLGGELFDISAYIDKSKLQFEGEEILFQTKRKKQEFLKGYHFLSAALPLLRYIDNQYEASADVYRIVEAAELLAKRVLGEQGLNKKQHCRKLFLSAITPEGFTCHGDSLFEDTYCVAIKGNFGTALFVRHFAELCRQRGFDTELFYCPMHPEDKVEHLYIPELRFSLMTYNYYTHGVVREVIELDEYTEHISGLGDCYSCADTLMRKAIDAFGEAKAAHRLLESVYIPAMDFDALEERSHSLIHSIF